MAIETAGISSEQALATLADMTAGAEPICHDEYRRRLAQLQQLMQEADLDALYIDASSSLLYFTGIKWNPSERLTGALLTAGGQLEYLVPAFERGTFDGMQIVEGAIYCWHEHESPYLLFKQVLATHNLLAAKIAVDPATPFFRFDLLQQSLPSVNWSSAQALIQSCRQQKSAAELALMQIANNMTLAVQQAVASILYSGISAQEVVDFIHRAHQKVGAVAGSTFCIVLFGADTAFPHGVKQPKALADNDMVLIDTGCQLYGYHADITRSYLFGEASAKQRQVWQHEQEAQLAAFNAAQIGRPCHCVDDAVRETIIRQGYAKEYGLPGVPHRTGHGIGLDIHESPNLVGGESTLLAPGMCFSIEPMICIPGEFGIRHEDHIYMTENGPVWFTQPALSIDDPFGNCCG